MSDHQTAIDAIKRTDSDSEIRNIVRGYSPEATGGRYGGDPDIDHALFFGAVDRKTGWVATTARDPGGDKETVLTP